MEVIRYKYIFFLLTSLLNSVYNEKPSTKSKQESTTPVCPFTKIIEDIFKIHNKTSEKGIFIKDSEPAKSFLSSIANITAEEMVSTRVQEELVNDIIASINRIKNNITLNKNSTDPKLNEAIILHVPKDTNSSKSLSQTDIKKYVGEIKSGMEDKIDNTLKNQTIKEAIDRINEAAAANKTTDKKTYVEILTIEPNNTNTNNTSSANIIEVLKHLMPMFNSTLTKELHNITIIERNHNRNHSFTATKNVSTIFVTYCDKENKTNITMVDDDMVNNSNMIHKPKPKDETSVEDDYFEDTSPMKDYDDKLETNLTVDEKKDILEATQYGMQKMHELYSILEPKLYSMGLWLDDTNPARYVAAFNAPSEDAARYSRYGYATLQAATKLKQLLRLVEYDSRFSTGNEHGIEARNEEAVFPTAGALRQSPLLQQCPIKGPPKCPPASKRYRTHDGTCNNVNRPRWGSTMTAVQRFLPASYSDGLQAPRRSIFGPNLPSAREISSSVHEDKNAENLGVTHLLMQWGQFLDHDVTSSSQSRGFNGSVPRCCKDGGKDFVAKELMHPECMPIAVPKSDPFYGPRGVRCLDFVRSSPAPHDDCALGWREQLNQVSAYIDGSPVYASSARQSDKLRMFRNGMLQYGRVQQRRPLLPVERKDELCRGGAVSTDCFKSGDARVNEHPGLVAAHIVWLRQHNRMAQELAHLNPHWSDEKIYQETRKIVGAMIQHITYREFLPIVLGSEVMRLFDVEPQKKGYYRGYDPKINPSPASSFGSAAFRFGHSLVQPSMVRFDRFHRPINNNVSLHNEMTNPSNIWSMGAVDRLLLGMVNQPIQNRDEFITEELTNHLFQTPSFNFGMDLAAINIQRGRDHGVAPYTAWREPCGLSEISGFEDMFRVMPARAVRKLQSLYRHVDDIDLFTGGMAERPVVGGLVGPTFACIIAQQFSNLRKGDRFWYENGGFDSSFTPAQLQQIRRISLAQILCHTLDTIDNIQPFVFLSPDNPDNERISCQTKLLNDFDLSPWVEIHSDNDISKSSDDDVTTQRPTTQRPRRTKTTTTVRPMTKKTHKFTAAASNTKPAPANFTDDKLTEDKHTILLNHTETPTEINKTKLNDTAQSIDDKLDFKFKTKRYEDDDNVNTRNKFNKPTKQYDYDSEESVQSVQSVIINNLSNKRPYNYNRPVMTVTENIDKYTYLINYVPRPTESWRRTTKRNYDRDVVKVTYQTYDDTYRRPTKPTRPYYHNRPEYNDFYRHDQTDSNGDKMEFQSSARSNDETMTTPALPTIDKLQKPTTDRYKLVTFGYVGTYKGSMNEELTNTDGMTKGRRDSISKDFSTYEGNDNMRLSTFFHYETATQPYHMQRPIRRDDDDLQAKTQHTNSKYYYIKNVLHKLTDGEMIPETDMTNDKEPPNIPLLNVEERSVADKLAFLEDEEKISKLRLKIKKPSSPAKTPSVAFQVIPSENNPSQWAVYEENADLPEGLPHRMPIIMSDPYALKEIPRPMRLGTSRKRPGRS